MITAQEICRNSGYVLTDSGTLDRTVLKCRVCRASGQTIGLLDRDNPD